MTVHPSLRWKNYEPGKNIFRPILRELEKAGREIIKLTSGDPVVHGFVNEPINEYLIEAVRDGWNMYADSSPWPSKVKEAIADFEKRFRGGDYSPDDILITPGCAAALFAIHYSLLDAGDEVVAFDPSHYLGGPTSYWSCFGARAVPCPAEEENGWSPDVDDLRSMITEKTKAIFVNNPNNPTGAVYDEKALTDVVDIAGENDLLLIGDEIYGLIVFDGKEASSLGAVAKDVPTIVINGMSKFFMRTGWRFGYICLHDPAEKAPELMSTVKSATTAYGHATRGVATPIMAAATKAFENSPLQASIDLLKELQKRRDYIMRRIEEIEGISCVKPAGALYAFPKIDLIPTVWKSDEEFLIELLKKEQVLFNAGIRYGDQGFGHFRTLLMPVIEVQEEVYNRVERLLKSVQ